MFLWAAPVAADGPSLGGVGGIKAVFNPHDGYVYVLNSNDSVSVVDGTQIVTTIDLPTGIYGRLTDLDVAANGDVYVSQWFYDQVIVLRNKQIYGIIPRQRDDRPGANGIENGPLVVAANPVNNLVYVATSWGDEAARNGVTILDGLRVAAHVPTGFYPQAIGINPITGLVFVANADSDTVTVLSETTAVKHIPVGDYPVALGVDAAHGLVYVANRGADTVSIIDVATLSVLATLSSGAAPMALYVDSAAGRAYVINHNSDTVSLIDGVNLTRTATITVGHSPLAVTGDPSSGLIYVANQVSNTVTVIQGTAVTATIPVGGSPVALVRDPNNDIYVVNFLDATLSLLRGTSNVATIGGLPRLSHVAIKQMTNGHVAVADLTDLQVRFLDGTNVISTVQALDGFIDLYDTPAHAPPNDYLKVAHEPVAVDDQDRVFVASYPAGTVSVVTENGPRPQTVWIGAQPYDLEVMPRPDVDRVYVTTGNGVVVITPTETSYLWMSENLSGARALAVWPEKGRVYIARSPRGEQARVAIIDDGSLSVAQVIDVCRVPASIEIDRTRGWVYVACSESDAVGVISDTTWMGYVLVGAFPQDMVINPVNDYAYVAVPLSNQVAVLDGLNLQATIPVPDMPIAVDADPDTGLVYVTCEVGNAVAVISGTSLLTTIPTGKYPDAVMALTDTVYVGNAHSAALDIFRFTQVSPDPGNGWAEATAIVSGTVYAAPIQDEGDIDWYKIHLAEPGSMVTITLGGLPLDYDLAFFSPLTSTEPTSSTIETLDMGQVLDDGRLQSLSSWVDLGQLRSIPYSRGGVGATSTNNLLSTEVISEKIWETGDYYIAVWGHNGAHDDRPYVLRAQVSPPPEPITQAEPIPPISLPPPPDDSVRVLLVTNGQRLQNQYGITRTSALSNGLATLANAVSGTIVYLENYADVVEAYSQWDSLRENPVAANYVADNIKHIVEGMLTASYTNTEHIVLVGNDNIVPFRRLPDATRIANERGYNAWVTGNSPMAARIRGGYVLSDDFYASNHPLTWQGRKLYIPERSIGRLVETPEEIVATIDAYLTMGASSTVTTALVTGYDFLVDGSVAVSATLASRGVSVTSLISDGWTANQLRPLLLEQDHDLISLNGHFNHQALLSGDEHTYITSTEVANATTSYADDLVFTVGCQGGLNVPDENALGEEISRTLDFAQAFAGRGAVYIANTGYGYGDSDAIGYSELLALKLSQQLAHGPLSAGKALMQAKQRYYADAAYASFGDFDQKVLNEWTLYGLPMLEIALRQRPAVVAGQESLPYQVGTSYVDSGLYATSTITITPTFSLITSTRSISTVIGNYYQVDGDVQVSPGRPLQPRVAVDLQTALPQGHVVRGALFLGGKYTTVQNFDPVISRVVSDTAASEPPFAFDRWYPQPMHVVNRLQFGQDIASEKLVVIPAQYLAATEITGTERLYSELRYEVYTATETVSDFLPPAIQYVKAVTTANAISFTVLVTDPSGIDRVAVAYDNGAGEWNTFDLHPVGEDRWVGEGPPILTQCFVQAVDKAGNVTLSDNKGIYFAAVSLRLSPNRTGEARPEETVTYVHTLTNMGGGEDAFLVKTVSSDWLIQHSPAMITLKPGGLATVTVSVSVPPGLLIQTTNIVTVTATSLSNQDVFGVVTDTTTAIPYRVYLPIVLKSQMYGVYLPPILKEKAD
jgi:YVTN family beta-propeller protein